MKNRFANRFVFAALAGLSLGSAAFAAQNVIKVDGIASIKTKPIASRKANVSKARLRFSGEMLFIEKNGKRFNLNGHRIK